MTPESSPRPSIPSGRRARAFPPEDPGYGFVAAGTPELAVAVLPAWRGRDVGAALMAALIAACREAGTSALSLSVRPDNRARHLYERLGLRQVGEVQGSPTMLLRL